MMAILGKLLGFGGAVAGPIVEYFNKKQELASLERQQEVEFKKAVHLARLENIKQGKINEAEWNLTSIRNSSWKDEWLTIILSIPLVCVFIPPLVDPMMQGFAALEATPEWYRIAVGIMVASAFGYQKMIDYMNRRKYE